MSQIEMPEVYGQKVENDYPETSRFCDFCKRFPAHEPHLEPLVYFTPGCLLCSDPFCKEIAIDSWLKLLNEDRNEDDY